VAHGVAPGSSPSRQAVTTLRMLAAMVSARSGTPSSCPTAGALFGVRLRAAAAVALAEGSGWPPPLMSPASGFARRSSLTSLRRPPAALGDSPSSPAVGTATHGTEIGTPGRPVERGKGGGARQRRAPEDTSATGRPGVPIARHRSTSTALDRPTPRRQRCGQPRCPPSPASGGTRVRAARRTAR